MANLGALLRLEGRTIGGCRLIRRLGAGGMGEVYLAEQVRLGNRRVAVKIVRPDVDSGQDYRDAARRFLHEGRMLVGFAHPNVLPVHDSGVEDGCFYLVMEYAPDGSLKDAISGRGPHPLSPPVEVSLAVEIVVQIASALQYTHDRGIVHGDVKPGNVLVEMESDGHRRMLLADYGVARDLEATAQISLVTGTVAYMAPEQFSGGFSPASDQYALAVVAYQLLAGHPPFEGGFAEQMRGHLDLAPPSLRGANPAVPRSVEAVIRRGLAKEPSARYPTVLAFADALVLALRPETENTIFGAPGAWDATITMRPALANRRQQPARARAERPPVRMHRTHQPPDSDGHVFFANESATEQFPYAAPTTRHLDQRRIGVFAICAALLLVAMLVAIGTNGAAKTHALAPDTQDIALGGHPRATTTTTPGQSPTPTATPRSTPNAIENDLTGDAFTVAGISAPSSVAPGQPITASITLVNSGFNTWTSVGGYRLTCDGLRPHTAHSNCPSGFSVSLGQVTVSPGASITFVITLKAPGASGAYNAWLSMAHGNALFSTMPALLSLAVQVPAPTATPVPPATATPQPTNTPTPQPTNTPTPQPTNTPTPQPTNTPTPQPTDTPTPQPTPTNTPLPTPTAQATDTPQPTSTVQSTDPPADMGTPSAAPATATRSLALWLAV